MKNLDEVREFWVFINGMSGKVIGAENSDYKPSGISGGGSTQAIKVVEKKSYSKLKDEEWRKVVEPLKSALIEYSNCDFSLNDLAKKALEDYEKKVVEK